jgi:hypothetical protein
VSVIPMPGKKEVPKRRSGLRSSKKELPERLSGVFRHRLCPYPACQATKKAKKSKAVPLHAMVARGGRECIAPTHS